MCLIVWGLQLHPRWKLILVANRDEYLDRETSPSYFWQEHPNILAGKDILRGGTWLGITKEGRIAAITNFRTPFEEVRADALSRGELLVNFLKANSLNSQEYLKSLAPNVGQYNPFNLLLIDLSQVDSSSSDTKKSESNNQQSLPTAILNTATQQLESKSNESKPTMSAYMWYLGSRYKDTNAKKDSATVSVSEVVSPVPLQPGVVYGMSNAVLDTPWPKLARAKKLVTEVVEAKGDKEESLIESLFEAFMDVQRPPDSELPKTGVSSDWEKSLSSIFVSCPKESSYGTRSQVVLLVSNDNRVTFVERTLKLPSLKAVPEFAGGVSGAAVKPKISVIETKQGNWIQSKHNFQIVSSSQEQ